MYQDLFILWGAKDRAGAGAGAVVGAGTGAVHDWFKSYGYISFLFIVVKLHCEGLLLTGRHRQVLYLTKRNNAKQAVF